MKIKQVYVLAFVLLASGLLASTASAVDEEIEAGEGNQIQLTEISGTDVEFNQSSAACGTAVDDASVDKEIGNESYYEIEGVYQTPNPCQKLSHDIDMNGSTVVVNLTNEAEEGAEICRQCIGQIEYSINVTAPENESVEIYHEDELIVDESMEDETLEDQKEEESSDEGLIQRFISFFGL